MSLPRQLPQACLFDLDGTLVDSLPDVAAALNECLDLLGLDPRPLDQYRYLAGDGIPALCRRVLRDSHPHLLNRLIELARARYRAGLLCQTTPFPGISTLLGRLRDKGVRLAVLSNKPHDMTLRVVHAFWPADWFDRIQGCDEERRKPDPYHVLQICGALHVDPARTWLVGDTPTDVLTAARSGTICIGVTWGFRPRADLEAAGAQYILEHPEDLA